MADKNHNNKALGDVIRELLHDYNLEGKLSQARIIEAWPKVTGDMITKHTRDLFIKGRTLFVYLDSPALKNELSYSKSKILEELNKHVGEEVITNIVFK